MNNIKKLFFALAVLASMSITHAAGKKLSVSSFRQATVYTKDAATQTEAEPEDTAEVNQVTPEASSPSRLSTMLAFMKMQLHTRHRILGFLAHQSKNAVYWTADFGRDVLKSALKDVLKSKAEEKIKNRLGW